jgi:hypothetical protein
MKINKYNMDKILWKMALAMGILCVMNSCSRTVFTSDGYIGPSEIEIKDGEMTPEVLLSLGRLSDPQLSPDGTKIIYGVSYTSIKENRSCCNIFLVNPDGTGKKQLTTSGKSISNARWIDGGKAIAFIMDGQIYKSKILGLDSKDNTNARLTDLVKLSDIKRGISEFKVSPDGKSIIYVSTIPGNVKTPADSDPALDKARAYVTEDLMYRHWDHWVTELPHSFVAPFNKITEDNSTDILGIDKYELPTEPFSGIEQLDWSPDSRYIAYSCKKLSGKEYAFSTNTDIYIFDTKSGKTVWVPFAGGYDTDPVWSPDGKHLAWISMSRDGYEADKTRLVVGNFTVSENGEPKVSDIRDLTIDFKYNASSPLWSNNSKSIYFSSLVQGLKAIYVAGIEIPGDVSAIPAKECSIVRLTPEDALYDFNTPFAVLDDGTMLSSYCSMDFPKELVTIKDNGTFAKITDVNDNIINRLAEHKTEAHYIKTVDGKDMLTWVLYPPKFDSTKVYPAIEILLGGPQGTLSQGWSYRWNYRLMAAQGYIVVLPNRRGTTAFGQDWTEQISGDYVGLNIQDYLSAAKWIRSKPYVGKLAGCGASYGGFSAYYLAGVHENMFDCFIAHAGIFDEKYMYYETEEMWFPNWDNGGLSEYSYTKGETGPRGDGVTFGGIKQGGSPWSSNPKAVRHYANSPDRNVTKWNTPILCIHGGKDFRIPYDQGMAAFNAAQMMGVPSKLIVFPDENHWILQPQNALFWHRSYFDWLNRWCK